MSRRRGVVLSDVCRSRNDIEPFASEKRNARLMSNLCLGQIISIGFRNARSKVFSEIKYMASTLLDRLQLLLGLAVVPIGTVGVWTA